MGTLRENNSNLVLKNGRYHLIFYQMKGKTNVIVNFFTMFHEIPILPSTDLLFKYLLILLCS